MPERSSRRLPRWRSKRVRTYKPKEGTKETIGSGRLIQPYYLFYLFNLYIQHHSDGLLAQFRNDPIHSRPLSFQSICPSGCNDQKWKPHSTYCFPSSFDLPPSFPPQSFAAWKMMDGLDYIRILDDGNDTLPRKQRPSDLRDAQRRESNTLGDSSTSPPPPVERERCECSRFHFMALCVNLRRAALPAEYCGQCETTRMRNPNGASCFTQQLPCSRSPRRAVD